MLIQNKLRYYRILTVHNRYLNRGGEDTSFESVIELLKSNGHEVIEYVRNNQDIIQDLSSWKMGVRTIWSSEDYEHLRQIIREKQPHILHVQNFFPLISPSAYYAAKAEGVPVIQTLQNYRLLCPNALFLRENRICEDCLGKLFPWPGVVHACYRDSRAASGAVALMLAAHRIMRTWQNKVDIYIVLTEFARRKFIEGGLPASKLAVMPNFLDSDPGLGKGEGKYALFVSRLSSEKGLDTLFSAWEKLKSKFPLKIVGDGPLTEWVIQTSKDMPEVEYLGRKPLSEVYELMRNAYFLVFTSKCYEGVPMTVIESFGTGTPVIAPNQGATGEIISDMQSGLLFYPGDAADLASKIEWLLTHPKETAQMRQSARFEFENKYTASHNYKMLMSIYETAISSS